MIEQKQRELADYVKNVHLSLRRKSQKIGAEKAWEEHLKNEEVLREYSVSMQKLAEEYWSVNNCTESGTFLCRIEWIVNYVSEYFQKGLIFKEVDKEIRKMAAFQKKGLTDEECRYKIENVENSRLKLLDVGSCFNPFGKFTFLEVYPIDLYPANGQVKKCNFIQAEVTSLNENWFYDDLKKLPSTFFDVVVFSLFLEYLPSPKFRYAACQNAHKCLKTNGLLLIVTPDSKHASANAGLMKSWKMAAAHIGFARTRLEKLKYLHCMAFRKTISQNYPLLLYNVKSDRYEAEEMFKIPQDSVDYNLEVKFEKNAGNETSSREMFDALPFSQREKR